MNSPIVHSANLCSCAIITTSCGCGSDGDGIAALSSRVATDNNDRAAQLRHHVEHVSNICTNPITIGLKGYI